MRPYDGILLVAALVAADRGWNAVRVFGDTARFQGRWGAVHAEEGGRAVDPGRLPGAQVFVEGDNFYLSGPADGPFAEQRHFRRAGGLPEAGVLDLADVEGGGGTVHAAYEFDGDRLTLTLSPPDRADDAPGGKGTLRLVLARLREGSDAPPDAAAVHRVPPRKTYPTPSSRLPTARRSVATPRRES